MQSYPRLMICKAINTLCNLLITGAKGPALETTGIAVHLLIFLLRLWPFIFQNIQLSTKNRLQYKNMIAASTTPLSGYGCWNNNHIASIIQIVVNHLFGQFPVKFQLQLRWFLPCKGPRINFIHICNDQEKNELLNSPPFCPPLLLQPNMTIMTIVVIVNQMLCLIMARNWLALFEGPLNSTDLATSLMVLDFVEHPMGAHQFCYITLVLCAMDQKLIPLIFCSNKIISPSSLPSKSSMSLPGTDCGQYCPCFLLVPGQKLHACIAQEFLPLGKHQNPLWPPSPSHKWALSFKASVLQSSILLKLNSCMERPKHHLPILADPCLQQAPPST